MRTIQYRRKTEGKTDYRKRLNMLSTRNLRLVVRPTLKNLIVQVIQYEPKGDKVLAGTTSKNLLKFKG